MANWLRCNIWHIRGRSHDLLIDSGMGLRPLKKEISALTEKPVICISSHAHFDHIGGAHEFDQRLGHKIEQHIHAAPDQHNSGDWEPFVRAETFSALPHDKFDYHDYQVHPAPLTGFLDEGDVVDIGNRHFSVLHLPGHSPGSIALYEEKSRTLFSGDTVYDGHLFDSTYHSDKAHYRESLKRLKELPIEVIHGGHYDSFDKVRLDQIIDSYLAGNHALGNPADWVSSQMLK